MAQSRKRTRVRVNYKFNIGTVCFIIIFIYIVIRLGIYVTKPKITSYEVTMQHSESNISATALVLRNDQVVKTDSAGYITYYVREGDKIAKNDTVYTVDESGNVYDLISESQEENQSFTDENYADLKKVISNFKNYYSDDNFRNVYDFKYNLENRILDITNETVISQINDIMKEKGSKGTFKTIPATESGIVTYSYDNLEGVTLDTFTENDFDQSAYTSTPIRNNEIFETGANVYRLTLGLNWSMVIPLSDKQVSKLSDKETTKLKILKDNRTISVPVNIVLKDGKSYLEVSLTDFMTNYVNDRYLDVDILVDSVDGLKIPRTCFVNQDLYAIPKGYSIKIKDSDAVNFNIKNIDKSGTISNETIAPEICYEDDDYYYVMPTEVLKGTIVVGNDSNEDYVVAQSKEFTGVYSVNQGYVEFRYVNVIHEGDDFSIVESGVSYSISNFDQLILDSSLVKMGDVLY